MADRYATKRIADAVHGTIGLSKVETAVIDTAAFQRLHNVRHLGLAYLVYPTANYSRFSHGLGACHVTGRLVQQILARKSGSRTSEEDERTIQIHRLAGLLHDVGHYPFSHALETAVDNYYSAGLLTETPSPFRPPSRLKTFKDHEALGHFIIAEDPELRKAIESNDLEITVKDVLAVFSKTGHEPGGTDSNRHKGLVSSDLDADRLDYLLRTATLTGLPYGTVDIDYLVSQIQLDLNGNVAFGRNAIRAVDQLLLARFFDYRQVSFHKTVAAMEWLLVEVVPALLFLDTSFDLSENGLRKRLESKTWQRLNDAYVIELIEKYFGIGQDDSIEKTIRNLDPALAGPLREVQTKARALLARKPPRLVAGLERFQPRLKAHDANLHRLTVKMAKDFKAKWSDEFKIDEGRWHVWSRIIRLTKFGANVPMPIANDAGERNEDSTESARIVIDEGAASVPINNLPQALTSLLADYDYRIMRIFVLFDPDVSEIELKALRAKIFDKISRDMQDAGWTYPRRIEGTEDVKRERFGDPNAGEGDDEDDEYSVIPDPGVDETESENKMDEDTTTVE